MTSHCSLKQLQHWKQCWLIPQEFVSKYSIKENTIHKKLRKEIGYELLEDSYEELGYEMMMKNISKEEIYMDKIWLQLSWTNFQNASNGNKLINASYQLWHNEVAEKFRSI